MEQVRQAGVDTEQQGAGIKLRAGCLRKLMPRQRQTQPQTHIFRPRTAEAGWYDSGLCTDEQHARHVLPSRLGALPALPYEPGTGKPWHAQPDRS